jgi:drug/metabolite transporter (DMT)-like permease
MIVAHSTTMNNLWMIYSVAMFLASIFLYTSLRFAKLKNISVEITNFVCFFIPALLIGTYMLINRVAFEISIIHTIEIFIAAFFFSYLGNAFSLKGIKLSSNPGFSLIIQKSYSAFTILITPFIFGSQITLLKIAGTIVIIVFAGIISIEKGKKLFSRHNEWLIYTILAFFAFGFLSIFSKYILNEGVNLSTFSLELFSFVALMSLVKSIYSHKLGDLKKENIILFICIGVFSFLFNIFMNSAIKEAPNIGYVNSINASSIAALSIIYSIFFKDELNKRKLIGVTGVFAGLLLIFL